jgi:transposase
MLAESHDEEQIIARVAALDIAKAELVCCVRVPAPAGGKRRLQDVATYSTMTRSLTELANRLVEMRVQRVVMEATSSYWKPVFYLLEAHGLDPWLVNARDVKHLPGRPKTDVLDAVWLCKVAERQMLRPSFVPPWPIRRLRDLTRYRTDLVAARTAEKNRVEKLLEDACIKLSVVASDIFGVSGRAMLAALVAGERDPKVLAQLARARMRGKIDRLEQAFDGHFADHHRFLLSRMLARIEGLDADITAVDAQIDVQLAPFAEAAARLDESPGIGPVAAAAIIAEIGVDMSRFPTAGHLCSWAKFAPGINSSAGKSKAALLLDAAIRIWRASWVRPLSAPQRQTHSSPPATAALPDAAANPEQWSPSAAPSWSSSGTCCMTQNPDTTIWAPITTPDTSTPLPRSAATFDNLKPSATRSHSLPPPNHVGAHRGQLTIRDCKFFGVTPEEEGDTCDRCD